MTESKIRELERRVLAKIGRPAGFIKVEARPLWGSKYRVNVWAVTSRNAAGEANDYPRIVYSEIVEV